MKATEKKERTEKSEARAARSVGGGKKSLFMKIGIIAGAAVLVLIIVFFCLYRAGYRPYLKVVSAAGDSIKFSGMVNADGTPIKGKLYFADGSSATVNSETGEIEYSDGSVYIGELHDLQKNGKGKLTYASGDVYEGQLVNGKKEGKGIYKWADGSSYEGEYKDNRKNGTGTYTWADGATYTGEYKDDLKNGTGTYTYASGDVYEGEYKDDVRSGSGTFTWANGEKYVGEFENNQMNGSGTYTWPSGRTFQGYFENGAIVEIDTSASSSSGDASAETTSA